MSGFVSSFIGWASTMMAAGTFEIILLIVVIITGMILLMLALWSLWKLLVLIARCL